MFKHLPVIINIVSLIVYLIIAALHNLKNYENKIKGNENKDITTKQYVCGLIYVATSIWSFLYMFDIDYYGYPTNTTYIIILITLILMIPTLLLKLYKNHKASNKLLMIMSYILIAYTTFCGILIGVNNFMGI